MIRKGEPWGSAAPGPAHREVTGSDRDLATAVARAPGVLVRFHPDETSDIARTVGLRSGDPENESTDDTESLEDAAGTAVPMDTIRMPDGVTACNMCVLGTAPDAVSFSTPMPDIRVAVDGNAWFSGPATTVIIATGQFLRGIDLVPRGHPGDGRLEIQVYALERRERRAMRARLATGSHVPHPRIHGRSGRRVTVNSARPLALEIDRESRPGGSDLLFEVVPGAYRLLI